MRAATLDDDAAIAAIYAPHVLTGTATFETGPPDAEAMRARMSAGDGLYPWLVGEDGGAVVGYAYASRFHARAAYRHSVETTIYLAPDARARGHGRSLYTALLTSLRAQRFTQAIAAIALPNDPSVRLHEALGFRAVGIYRDIGFKLGQWIDVGHWQCTLEACTIPPLEPVAFAELSTE